MQEIIEGTGADSDGDGVITVTELLELMAARGASGGCSMDLDGNGVVDTVDLLELIAAWGRCDPTPAL